jgi:hypothetical protein
MIDCVLASAIPLQISTLSWLMPAYILLDTGLHIYCWTLVSLSLSSPENSLQENCVPGYLYVIIRHDTYRLSEPDT